MRRKQPEPEQQKLLELLHGEDRAGCGSEWREDQGDAAVT